MAFSPTLSSFSLRKMEARELGCLRGWHESSHLDCPPRGQQWWGAQTPCVGRSASEPVPRGFASRVGFGAASQQICVKAWELSSVTFDQKCRRVRGKLILDLVAICKLEMSHTDHYFSIFSAGRNVKPCKLFLSLCRQIILIQCIPELPLNTWYFL